MSLKPQTTMQQGCGTQSHRRGERERERERASALLPQTEHSPPHCDLGDTLRLHPEGRVSRQKALALSRVRLLTRDATLGKTDPLSACFPICSLE